MGTLPKSRQLWIDANKGFAIIIVVLYHVTIGLVDAKLIEKSIFMDYFWIYATATATPVFFLMSGYFIEKSISKVGYKQYVKNACHYVLYPYILWSIVQLFSKILFSSYVNGKEEIDFLFLLTNPQGQFWFLHALFFSQILFIVFYKYGKEHYLLVATISLVLSLVLFQQEVLANVMRSFGLLLLGAYANKKKVHEYRFSTLNIILLSTIFILSGLLYLYYLIPLGFQNISNFVGGISITILLSVYFLKFENLPLLEILGRYSMYIFVMHIMCLVPFRVVLPKLGLDTPILLVTICTLSGILLPIFVAQMLEKLKISEYLGIKSNA